MLLGETGVGKSTFINAFANYVTFETIDQGQNGEIVALIPSSFTVFDEQSRTNKKIEVGSDDNEHLEQGQAATQKCQCYKIRLGDRWINLIDTPGLGDPRGVDQDYKNLEDILVFLTRFDYIHCICVLVKPTNARLNLYLKFVFDMTLSNLHISASKNIVFVYTHSRCSFFNPGETGPTLKKKLDDFKKEQPALEFKLDKNTQYCIDSEAFRFLLSYKQGEFHDYFQ